MAELNNRYAGIELYDADGKKVGTIAGLLTADDLHQYYVVEHGGFLGFGKSHSYVPADRTITSGGRRLDTEVPSSRFGELGWDEPPVDMTTVDHSATP
jgi:hypothetical protein